MFENLKRTNQEGRFPLQGVAPSEFCYHSLQRIWFDCITIAHPLQVRKGVRFLRSSNRRLAQNTRASLPDARGFCQLFGRSHPKNSTSSIKLMKINWLAFADCRLKGVKIILCGGS